MIGTIALIIILVVDLIFILKHILFTKYVLWHFKHCNVIVAGAKGTGKGCVFQWVINKRHDAYYSNIDYGGKFMNVNLKDVSCHPNYYENIVNDKIVQQEHHFYEGKDIYIDDIGIFLPSYMDSKLYNKFPSMPIYYALSRHLYSSNVHCNTQNITRGWKALREQADFYIQCKRTYNFGLFLMTTIYTYDNYDSAVKKLKPVKKRLFNKFSKAETDVYNAQVGEIKKGHIFLLKSSIKYDTRAFEKIMLKGERKYYKKKTKEPPEVVSPKIDEQNADS